jgi:hypothetical protein
MRKIEPFYQTHRRLDELNPETDYREIVYLCVNRIIPSYRVIFDLLIYSTVLQSSVPPEDFPVLYRKGKGTFMKKTEKRMCDQNIIFSTFFNHQNREEYEEAIRKMNYMHAMYPDYINQRSLFRAGIKFASFLTVAEKTIYGEYSQFKVLRQYSDKFEQSMHLLWSEIFSDMKIKGMPNSYQDMIDFIYDKEQGPIPHDYIPAGNPDVRHYYQTFEQNFLEKNFSGWKRIFAPLGRRFLVLSMPKTTRESVGEQSMKGEWLFAGLLRTLLRVVSLRAIYLPSFNRVGNLLKDHYVSEYQGCPKAEVEYVGAGTSQASKRYQETKDDLDLPWEGCPFHSDNQGQVGRYKGEYV